MQEESNKKVENPSFEEGVQSVIKIDLPDIEKFVKKYNLLRSTGSFFERASVFLISALGFIAALAWNEALKALFALLSNGGNTVSLKFLYAVLVTILAIFVTYLLRFKHNTK